MKDFVSRHCTAILVITSVLFVSTCALSAYVYVDFRADERAAQSLDYLNETLFKTYVRRLSSALSDNDTMSSYHFAVNAAETAAQVGLHDEALFFRKISFGIENGGADMTEISSVVSEYLESWRVPESFSVLSTLYEEKENTEEDVAEIEPSSVSGFRRWAAGVCASEIIGATGVLHSAELSPDGKFVFTCRNAYVVIDAHSGYPAEVGISMRKSGEIKFGEAECIENAGNFLREFFPPDIYRPAVLLSVSQNDTAGTFELVYRSGERIFHLSVGRDIGRVVRLVEQ